MENEKTCWRCKRVLIGKSKLGMCPDCINKYGTPAAAVGTGVLLVGGRILLKNGGKVVKVVGKGVKLFKG